MGERNGGEESGKRASAPCNNQRFGLCEPFEKQLVLRLSGCMIQSIYQDLILFSIYPHFPACITEKA